MVSVSTAPTSGTLDRYVWTDGANFTNKALTTASGYMDSPTRRRRFDPCDPREERGHRQRHGRWLRFHQWRDWLPEGPVRDVLRWAVGSDELQSRRLYRLRHPPFPADPVDPSRSSVAKTSSSPRTPKHLPTRSSSSRFLQQPLAQLAMASAGDMTAYKTNNANERKINPAFGVFAQAAVDRPGPSGHPGLRGPRHGVLQRVGGDAGWKGHGRRRSRGRDDRGKRGAEIRIE